MKIATITTTLTIYCETVGYQYRWGYIQNGYNSCPIYLDERAALLAAYEHQRDDPGDYCDPAEDAACAAWNVQEGAAAMDILALLDNAAQTQINRYLRGA